MNAVNNGALAPVTQSQPNAAANDDTTIHAQARRPAERGTQTLARMGVNTVTAYDDHQVRVVTTARLTPQQAAALAHKVERFYAWDAAQQHWKDRERLQGQLTVAMLDRGTFAAVTGDHSGSVGGFTTGPDLFVMPADGVAHATPDDDVTLAHELAHVQDFRQAGARLGQVPIYLQEGKAYLLGDKEPMSHGQLPRNAVDVARELSQITGAHAAWVMRNFRTAQDEANAGRAGFLGETVGGLFVEYLRLHYKGGHRDAYARVADVTAQVGQGSSYADSFQRHFGGTPADAEAAFVKWVRDTEGQPSQRLKGTLYQGV